MRIQALALGLLGLLGSEVQGKYFSEGWKPGQPTERVAVGSAGRGKAGGEGGFRPLPQPGQRVVTGQKAGGYAVHELDLEPKEEVKAHKRPSLAEGLISSINTATGINLTSAYLAAKSTEAYSRENDTLEGFTRLTDGNWEEQVGYERFEGGGALEGLRRENERVWVVMIHGPPRDPTSRIYYEAFTNASVATLEAGDMPDVKWGRLDFLTEWQSCARWLVFKPPVIVFATDRGRTLRFLAPRSISPRGEVIRRFVQEGVWRELPVWQSNFAPGGSHAWLVKSYITVNGLWSRVTARVPSWMLLIISGLLTQSVLGLLHRGNGEEMRKFKQEEAARIAREAKEKIAAELEAERKAGKVDAGRIESSGKSTATAKASSATPRKGKTVLKEDQDGVSVTVETKKAPKK